MKTSKKILEKHKKIRKQSGEKQDLEVIWEQVFPEDAERRIQRAFEILFNEIHSS